MRRPTADLDALARSIGDDQDTVVSLVSEIADVQLDDGVEFRTGTATSRIIRERALYSGVRIAMDTAISTATVKFRMDVNFGDPITPAPGWVTLPPLRAGMEPVRDPLRLSSLSSLNVVPGPGGLPGHLSLGVVSVVPPGHASVNGH